MLNIAVCDDEEVYLEEISDLIYQNASQDFSYNINKYLSGEELIDNFKNEKIDILFLDIEMKGMNGLETAKVIKDYYQDCIVFFVTSYNKYITDIFRLDSFQFLQKPIDKNDFKIDFERALKRYKNNHTLVEIKINGGIRNVFISEIKFIEVISREIVIHLKSEVIKHRGKINVYENKLKGFNFCKPHKSYLVNLTQIEAIETDRLYLRGINDFIPISRKYKSELLKEYRKYMMGRCL